MTDESVEAEQPIETPEDATGDALDTSGQAPGDAGEVRPKKTLSGGHDPAEMARKRWASVRARQSDEIAQAAHEAAGHAVIVRTTVQVGDIITSLAKRAAKDTGAARELRAYLADFPIESDTDVSALDRRTRQALLAMLIDDRLIEAWEDGSLLTWLEEREAGKAADPSAEDPHPRNDGTPVQ